MDASHSHKIIKRDKFIDVNNFTSRFELDSSIDYLKYQSYIGFNHNGSSERHELKRERHRNDHSKNRKEYSKLPNSALRWEKIQMKESKRGNSLEREITKLILNEAPTTYDSTLERKIGHEVSPEDILLDLIEGSQGASQQQSQQNETSIQVNKEENKFQTDMSKVRWKNSNFDASITHGQIDANDFESSLPNKSNSKISSDFEHFKFAAKDVEWAAFDDHSMFDIRLENSKKLDDNGFPILFGASIRKKDGTLRSFDSELNREDSSIDLLCKVEKEKLENSTTCSNEKSRELKSRTNLLCLSKGSKEGSYAFEAKNSPTSVLRFNSEESCKCSKNEGTHICDRQCRNITVLHQNLLWRPKPPKYLKHYSGEI